MIRSRMRFGWASIVLLCGWSLARTANAQSDDEQTVRRLALDRAQELSARGEHEQAVEYAERAGRIQMSPSIRYFLARELQQLHRNVEALNHAVACLREVTDATPRAEELRTGCRAISEAVRTRIAYVVVRVPRGFRTPVTLRINDRTIDSGLVGLPIPQAPGTLRIEARAEGFRSSTEELTVRAGETREHQLAFAPLTDTPSAVPAPAAPMAPRILVGVGGGLVAASFAFLGGMFGAVGACRVENGAGVCDTRADAERAQTWVPITTIGFHTSLYSGLALAGAGAVWWVLSARPHADEDEPRAWIAPRPEGGVELRVGGSL